MKRQMRSRRVVLPPNAINTICMIGLWGAQNEQVELISAPLRFMKSLIRGTFFMNLDCLDVGVYQISHV